MKERILCRKVMAWLMTAFMVITCLISIGGKNTAYAAAMENIKVTDVDISTDGHLRGLKWGWTTTGYASASCKLGIQSEKFLSGDLTNFGDYLSSHRYSGWASAESPEGCGFKGWITENSFSRSSGTYDRTDTISGEGIDMGTTGVYYLYTWTYYNGYVFPDIYIGSIDLNAGKIVDASGNEITFQIGGFSGGGNTDPSEEEVVFMNNGYPYGKNMTNSSITLVMDVTGEAATYQWQSATSKRGPFTDIEGANGSTYTFTPTHGYWYRCVVDGTASRAVKAVIPTSDNGNTWTKPNTCWYISNGVMAYMANGNGFDIVGLYTKDGKNYMLGTSYDKVWRLYSRSDSEPSAETATSQVSVASLAALRLSFDPMNTHDLIFDAELGEGQHSFAIGADANIGNEITSSDSADEAVLAATVKNGELQQIAMMGVAKVADAADDTPSFVLAPITQASYYWIGDYDSRRIFEYNTGSSSYIKETAEINGQNAASLVEGIDSGLTMSWTNVEDGGHIGFKFSVGAVADVGAVTGQVDYITENLTDLDGDTSYIITVDGESYEIVSDMYGDIALEGTDDNDVSYSLFGKNISISKKDSQDTPADITVAARPEAPSAPKTLADIQNPTPADMESAADGEGIEIVSVTGDSVTVSPLGGQQYQYSMDGAAWTVLDDLNVSDNYVISGLEENQRVYVRTRYVANTTRPASLWSDAKAVSRDLIAGVTAEDTTCTYDGLIHSPSVTIADGLDGASISYSLAADEPYTQTVPELKNAGTYKVYYLVTADECSPVFGDVTVTIEKKTITADKVIVDENAYIQGIQFSGLLDGEELVYDEDYTVVLWDVTPGIEKVVTTYRFGLATTGNAANYILQNKSWDMVHHHDWTHEVKEGSSNKIIAYCNETENPAHCAYQGRNEAVSCTVTAESRAYDGTEYAGAVVNNWITEKTGEAAVTYYEGTGDTDYPENENAPVNAGTYKFVVKIADVKAYAEFEIQRLDQNVEFDVSDYTFGDSIDGPKVTGAQEDPVIEYYYTTENSNTDGTLWENSRSADPGTYYMYAKVCATTNYNEYVTQPVQFTVAKREIIPAATTLKVGKVAAKTYGDAKFALNVKCSRNDKKTFTSSNTKVVKVDGTGKVTIVGAGKAVVTVSVAANQNYKAAAAKVAITVNPKAIRVTANDASKYEGKADPKFTFTAEGLVGKDKLTGIVLKRAAGEKSGTYTITASQKKGANPNYNITFAIGRLVIKKSPNVEPSGTELYKKTLPFFLMKGKGTGTRIDLTWDKVKGATGYDVYWSYCNGKNNFNKLANVPKSQKYADKNLNNKREYKYFTVAYKMSGGKKVYLGRTNTVHVAMPQASKTNVLKVTVNKTKVNLAKGKTFKITKKVKLENPKKKALNHLTKKERFITSNAKVATVSSAGVIKAVRKGTCTVYVMSENGVCAKIKVTVK
ncbi:MBG domain-containing protein [Coprococcus sp. TF11-13]|jgi:hypothetical protein|uniref:MBG domain-containing protein n=1 Tax=Coprococcus sp. TF11-13 TaxID=2293096 RepID=UPI000E4C65A1|nr:MBG domain-containing protein [Coprococcus sp. TF11-13]RHU50073.1 hypothetical protein DXD11_11300 [Coprococcus sp. TF11-13]